jgi:DNA-binding response OmpR family regulator
VDDDRELRALLDEALTPEGFILTMASNGEEALLLAQDDPELSLVLLDLMMPGLDGFEVCRRLRSSPDTAYLRIFMLTGRVDPETIRRSLQAGADGYLAKPFDAADLLAFLRRVLRLQDRVQPLPAPAP